MSNPLRAILDELVEFGAEHDSQATARHEKMLNITPETGELLGVLIRISRAQRVFEIGTSNGYSTLWLADAVRANLGVVTTVDHSPRKAEMARRNLERAGVATLVRQEVMDGGEFLRQQSPASCDLLFLDSDRGQYVAWWPAIQDVLAPGGVLVADNAVSHAAEMADFIARVRATPGWRTSVVPIGKGEFVAVRPAR